MGPATAILAAFAVITLCTAILNLCIFALRRRQAEHLWLAVASFGVFGLTWTMAAIYESDTLAEARAAQLASFIASIPLVVGFLRFTAHFTKVEIRGLERASGAYVVAVAFLLNAFTDVFFTGEAELRALPWLGQDYVMARYEPFTGALLSAYLLVFCALARVYWREREHIDSVGTLLAALLVWFVCCVNDTLVALGVYPGLFLVTIGYFGFTVAFTGILLRRFVGTMDRVQASAEELSVLVEERIHELREKDLQIAHGSRMATVGALAAGLAHEINNPIAFISANLSHLHGTWQEPDREEPFDDVLDETLQGIDRIRGIVSQLQRLARQGETIDASVDLDRVVEDVLPIVRHEGRDRATLETRLGPIPKVRGDDRLLGQVLLNLVVNALHAIEPGRPGENHVRVATTFEGGQVRLVVEDTGSGIPRAILPHIFDPFFTTKQDGEGTGLGLAVTSQIVERHRGRIEVRSGRDGTTFTVSLPPADEPTAHQAPHALAAADETAA